MLGRRLLAAGSWFVAMLHSFGNRETTALLGRIIRELRPIAQ
jgi:hypothetical protein